MVRGDTTAVPGSLRLLVMALIVLALATGCVGQQTLSKDQVDERSQEYFLRGMDQFQRGEFRQALESFRLAKAYDPQGHNPQIGAMIEKTEGRVRAGGAPASVANPAIGVAPRPTPRPAVEGAIKTHYSRLYPYAMDIPESWTAEPGGAKVANTPADLLSGPRTGAARTSVTAVAHRMPLDFDRRAYVEANVKLLRSQGLQPDEVGKRTVDGFETTLMRARVNNEQGKIVNTFAIFASQSIGWGLTFTAGAEESDGLQPLFHRMLDSFRIVDQPTV